MSNRSLRHIGRNPDGRTASTGWQELSDVIKYGDICFQAERYADALEAYKKALAEESTSNLPAEMLARLHYRVAACLVERGQYLEAEKHLDISRKSLPRHLDRLTLARIYSARGRIKWATGKYDRARRHLVWAQKILRGSDAHLELGDIENRLGQVHLRMGDPASARECFLSALATFRRVEHRPGEALTLNNLALLHKNQCDFREAVRYLCMARDLCESYGYRKRLVGIHLNLGIVHFKMGKWQLCEENLHRAMRLGMEMGTQQTVNCVQLAMANLHLRRQRFDDARSEYNKVLEQSQEAGYKRENLLAREFLAELELFQGNDEAASELLQSCLPEALEIAPSGDLISELERRLAEVFLVQGRLDDALHLGIQSAEHADACGDRYEAAIVGRTIGLAQIRRGDLAAGQGTVEESIQALAEIGDSFQEGLTHLEYGRCLTNLALAKDSLPEWEDGAVTHLQRAYGIFVDLDVPNLAAWSAYERARLETGRQRLDEAETFKARARQALVSHPSPRLTQELDALEHRLKSLVHERWSAGGDVLSSLQEIKRLFQGQKSEDPKLALDELMRLAVSRSRSSRGCLARMEDGSAKVQCAYGWDNADAQSLLDGLNGTLSGVLEGTDPVWEPDTQAHSEYSALAPFSVATHVILPFSVPGEPPGFLYVDKVVDVNQTPYSQGELQLLAVLANLTALSAVELKNQALVKENQALRNKIAGYSKFVTVHAELLELLRMLNKIASSQINVLIQGETGTGKSLLASMVHGDSDRAEHPFVQINCAAVPESLLESELFGHVKGAFTGANYTKPGLFQEADKGTVFLDEVDKTSLAFQAKLLQVLDTQEIRPVGALKSIKVDARVICATNTNLSERIREGKFLEDLFYRLNDFILNVPPLRDRPEDIPVLIDHFMNEFSTQYDRPGIRLSGPVHRTLLDQSWPGNVRELEKTIRRLVVLSEPNSVIEADLLPTDLEVATTQSDSSLWEEVARTEKRMISQAMKSANGNKSKAARILKISYPSMLKKLKEYSL